MTELNMFLQAVQKIEALDKERKRMVGAWFKYLEEGLKGSSIDWPKVNRVLDSMSIYAKSRGQAPNKTPSDGSPRMSIGSSDSGRTRSSPLTKTKCFPITNAEGETICGIHDAHYEGLT